eukprot:2420862-Alexandrium_andersonii.AAC.1
MEFCCSDCSVLAEYAWMQGGAAVRPTRRARDFGAQSGSAAAQDAVRRSRPRHFVATSPDGVGHRSLPSCRKTRLR